MSIWFSTWKTSRHKSSQKSFPDNETSQESKGHLKITNTSAEQILFQEEACLTVIHSQTTTNFASYKLG